MIKNFIRNPLPKNILISLFLVVNFIGIFTSYDSFAIPEYGAGRIRTCNTDGSIEELDFNPTNGGRDVEFVMSNQTCVAVFLSSYFGVKAAVSTMNGICRTGSVVPRIKPSPLLDARDIAKGGQKGLSTKNPACIAASATALSSLGIAIGEISIIWRVAKDVMNNSSVCGAEWTTSNPQKFDRSTPSYKSTVKNKIDCSINASSCPCATNPTLCENGSHVPLALGNKTYNEWYYDGVQFEDNPDDGEVCYDVTQAPDGDGNYPKQKYYLKGTEAGNYNCKKYLAKAGQNNYTEQLLLLMDQAYRCCVKRSSQYICIRYNPVGDLDEKYKFCKAGTNCRIHAIDFSAKSIEDNRYVCAQSHSLCPYNFTLGGGTEACDYFRDGKWDEDTKSWSTIRQEHINPPIGQPTRCAEESEIRNTDCTNNDKAGKCRNYCQYMTHCTRTSAADFNYNTSLTSPYFSDACINFIGDSQNKVSYGGGFILGSQKHFSAPIAQCIKETMENLFHNRAGHSKCLSSNEMPSADGTCPSGQYKGSGDYVQRKGYKVQTRSFFETIQDGLHLIVKLTITFSLMFYGMNLLLWKSDIREKKDILVYITKIALILYFATGDAWQQTFFDGVYGVSSEFSRMVFKIEVGQSELKRDGCQFGQVTTPDGITTSVGTSYPPGKEYLAIWDTLDCKIMRYLGFGPEASVANIASLIAASYLTPFAAVGFYFATAILFFGIFFISATVRALHIFLASNIAIVMLVFISPIIFVLSLFSVTKEMFNKWLSQLIGCCLQPMILFAYIAIFIIALDRVGIGSATFAGQGPFKAMSCSKVCKDPLGNVVNDKTLCDTNEDYQLINPLDDSVACLVNAQNFGKFPGFELIGLSIPIVVNLLSENPRERVLTLLKACLVMYLLFKFLDEIPNITNTLIGGSGLSGGSSGAGGNAFNNLKTVMSVAKGTMDRAKGAGEKLGKKLGPKDKAMKAGNAAGNKGKSATPEKGDSSGDRGARSGGQGADHGGSSNRDGGGDSGSRS